MRTHQRGVHGRKRARAKQVASVEVSQDAGALIGLSRHNFSHTPKQHDSNCQLDFYGGGVTLSAFTRAPLTAEEREAEQRRREREWQSDVLDRMLQEEEDAEMPFSSNVVAFESDDETEEESKRAGRFERQRRHELQRKRLRERHSLDSDWPLDVHCGESHGHDTHHEQQQEDQEQQKLDEREEDAEEHGQQQSGSMDFLDFCEQHFNDDQNHGDNGHGGYATEDTHHGNYDSVYHEDTSRHWRRVQRFVPSSHSVSDKDEDADTGNTCSVDMDKVDEDDTDSTNASYITHTVSKSASGVNTKWTDLFAPSASGFSFGFAGESSTSNSDGFTFGFNVPAQDETPTESSNVVVADDEQESHAPSYLLFLSSLYSNPACVQTAALASVALLPRSGHLDLPAA
ncbi:MAG: hypothetical protein MHM6MM_000904 [Cercozoa sp. M6MM]